MWLMATILDSTDGGGLAHGTSDPQPRLVKVSLDWHMVLITSWLDSLELGPHGDELATFKH